MGKIFARIGGSYTYTLSFLDKLKNPINRKIERIIQKYGAEGVEKLALATPKYTGKTSETWSYAYSFTNDGFRIAWENSNTNENVPIVIFIQYGHITKNGGYVPPNDFINPVIKPIVDKLTKDIWKEITK